MGPATPTKATRPRVDTRAEACTAAFLARATTDHSHYQIRPACTGLGARLPPGTLPRPFLGLPRCHCQLHDNSATIGDTCATSSWPPRQPTSFASFEGISTTLELPGTLTNTACTSPVLTCIRRPKREHCSTPSAGAHRTEASTFLSFSLRLQTPHGTKTRYLHLTLILPAGTSANRC